MEKVEIRHARPADITAVRAMLREYIDWIALDLAFQEIDAELDGLQEPGAFRGWFMRIVWRKAIDRRRSLRSWFDRFGAASTPDDQPMEFAAPDPAPDAILISRELAVAIAQVIKSLPRKLRDPFLLAASGDHRYEEIAAMLGTPLGTVKWRISEARRQIRMKLDRMGHGGQR